MAVHDAGQGQADAGFADAGFADAGFTDAGLTDAGLTDAGLTDAGLVDAGVGEGGDAGRLDAGALGVRVVGGGFERNGQPWRARGVSLVGLVGAPASLSKLGPYWQAAQTRLSSPTTRRALFSAFKAWGVDTLRFQVSQDGLDSNGAVFDSGYAPFVKTVVDDALAEGFVVIVSMRSEMPTFENACTAEQTAAGKPIDLPCSVTDRAWASLVTAGVTSHPDVMVEVFNEPLSGNTPNSAENWAVWKQAHQPRIDSLRAAGVASVLVADGVRSGKFAPPSPAAELDDPLSQLAYGIHPYPLLGPTLSYVKPADWEEAFGRSCTSNPASSRSGTRAARKTSALTVEACRLRSSFSSCSRSRRLETWATCCGRATPSGASSAPFQTAARRSPLSETPRRFLARRQARFGGPAK